MAVLYSIIDSYPLKCIHFSNTMLSITVSANVLYFTGFISRKCVNSCLNIYSIGLVFSGLIVITLFALSIFPSAGMPVAVLTSPNSTVHPSRAPIRLIMRWSSVRRVSPRTAYTVSATGSASGAWAERSVITDSPGIKKAASSAAGSTYPSRYAFASAYWSFSKCLVSTSCSVLTINATCGLS